MNFENFKISDGSIAVGFRITIPEGNLQRLVWPAPGYGCALIISKALALHLQTGGLTECDRVGIGGEIINCCGCFTTHDPSKAIRLSADFFSHFGIGTSVEFFIYDPMELYWRPQSAGRSEPFS